MDEKSGQRRTPIMPVSEWQHYPMNQRLQDLTEFDLKAAAERLETHTNLCSDTTYIDATSISPQFSFGSLNISLADLRRLLTIHSVFPGFLEVLHLYGEKLEEYNENLAVYRQRIALQEGSSSYVQRIDTFEMCYNWKYVARKTCNGTGRPIWTTRKMGMYSKHEYQTKNTTWIFLQASNDFQCRLNGLLGGSVDGKLNRIHDLDIHLLLMRTASQNWIPYINDLEAQIIKLDNIAFQWRPKPGNPVANDDPESQLELEDTQRIERLKVQLLSLAHALDINCSNITALRRGLETLQRDENFYVESSKYATEREYYTFDQKLDELLFQTNENRKRVKQLILRTDSLFAVVITIVPYIFARRENHLMLELSEKATQYAQSMKVITIVCMFYLPPSLIAAIFGMGLFNNQNDDKTTRVFTWFLVASVVLMLVTWIGLSVWERASKRRWYDKWIKSKQAKESPKKGGPRNVVFTDEKLADRKFSSNEGKDSTPWTQLGNKKDLESGIVEKGSRMGRKNTLVGWKSWLF
ncbi:Similar to hypothetical protein AOL_s00004g354 [Arthrobotrys oligospora ATCC 24927]; acc. no. EGX54321 [Pyronema omphalodes CBS 100304]|uniref:CorA-like transporter domain-containing protein n=1 Tax=Pyronema omphalodes (strain CBS 100304) TaxID=1076935 RepID=U4L097_PYROM|nr:Similar to hypothetical protein AOL_s00004g354 [Arthrobotrys oligospora ATCC 24927]; acc. no. EGX54321 [Pyronema omphalodes CBS 100304]